VARGNRSAACFAPTVGKDLWARGAAKENHRVAQGASQSPITAYISAPYSAAQALIASSGELVLGGTSDPGMLCGNTMPQRLRALSTAFP
jgi:hypothetical protein